MQISNSDFWILAGILSTIGGLGIYEGYEISPALYAQPAILFGGLGFFAFKAFYLDSRKEATSSQSPTAIRQY